MTILTLSRPRLTDFQACRRRFELRYLDDLPWPTLPLDRAAAERGANGRLFHTLLERYFLGLDVAIDAATPAEVRHNWAAFQAWWPGYAAADLALANGRYLPEMSLTVPVGNHLLRGRFDLLVVSADRRAVHIFDWKTGRPRADDALRADWQTRLYLALIGQSGRALDAAPTPANIRLTYWFSQEPEQPRTLRYSSTDHAQNWANISELVAAIDDSLRTDTWPLTPDINTCRGCPYQVFCDRVVARDPATAVIDDDLFWESQAPEALTDQTPLAP